MAIAQPATHYTAAEYLELERKALEKSEFFNGQIFAMAGGTIRHSIISSNVLCHLANQLQGKPCRPFDSNLRLHIPATGLFTYPDAMVICGPPDLEDNSWRLVPVTGLDGKIRLESLDIELPLENI